MKKQILTAVLTVTGLAALAGAQTTSTTTSTRTMNFPPAGLASTETARVNVTNVAANSSTGTAASCTGSVSFLNASGATIGSATSFTLTAGQTSSASLPFSSAGLSGVRGIVRALVTLTLTTSTSSTTTTATAPCQLLSSFETFDTSSGVTHILSETAGQSIGGQNAGGATRP